MGWREDIASRAHALYSEGRGVLAHLIANPGEGPVDDPGARNFHQAWAQGATENLANVGLPPHLAGGLVDTGGRINEMLTGGLSWLGGNGFEGEKGYDEGDIAANRRGIESGVRSSEAAEVEALREAQQREAARRALMAHYAMRVMRGAR